MKTGEAAFHPDDALVEMIRQDDAGAFEAVYNKYAAQLFHAAHAILKDREACEDIIQELFTDLWSKRHRLLIHNLKAYLFAATRNNVLMTIRSGKVKVNISELEQLVEQSTAADAVTEKELLQCIDRNVAQLPQKCRTIFILSREQKLSHKEIASYLNISSKTVENQMTIALKRLRSSLGDFMSFFL
ncbi:RNA polymerase sigma-70 factor [Chitinophaga cymbidii]|uniref:RNA polymerase sigma-70 factor n=1 Tax=Chitinophaga cymbidii TaxID=1096750 RepID=A0A512RQQ0_9BACT|nr:RNA polymerase sigma-70 factor [Chitinophaga cymbidii]GEP98029.1 RNA polymerase sigma-70 factor [Chitinophaga cymbidii]